MNIRQQAEQSSDQNEKINYVLALNLRCAHRNFSIHFGYVWCNVVCLNGNLSAAIQNVANV